ncbi:MAG: hypothetical protein WCS42_27740 [Verrucomicrobiota bacterium]
MELPKPNADQWWARISPPEKIFYRDLAALMTNTQPGQMVEVSFNGRSFQPVLIQEKPLPEPHHQPDPFPDPSGKPPARWWAGMPPPQKTFIQQLAGIVREVGGDQVLQLRNTGYSFKAALVLKLKPSTQPGPRGGNAATN